MKVSIALLAIVTIFVAEAASKSLVKPDGSTSQFALDIIFCITLTLNLSFFRRRLEYLLVFCHRVSAGNGVQILWRVPEIVQRTSRYLSKEVSSRLLLPSRPAPLGRKMRCEKRVPLD